MYITTSESKLTFRFSQRLLVVPSTGKSQSVTRVLENDSYVAIL